MTNLTRAMAQIRRLFEPWKAAPYGAVVWEPEAADPHASIKRGLIATALQVMAAGEAALASEPFDHPKFDAVFVTGLTNLLEDDPELNAFEELVIACEGVVQLLPNPNTLEAKGG